MDEDARIRAELSSLRASIAALDRALGGLDGKLTALDRRIGGLDRTVGSVSTSVSSLSSTVVPAVTRIESGLGSLAEEFRRSRVMEVARHARDDLDRELAEKFGRHEEVRRLAEPIIHAVSTGVIDDKMILDVAQRKMIDLPDYWLAPAVVAVAAWLAGDRVKCAAALDLALRLDRSKTALFMTLILRHEGRADALQRWIDVYLAGLRPRNLPEDFQVVIDGVAGGALGDGSAPKLADWMTTRYLAETESRDARTEATEGWQQQLLTLAPDDDFAPVLASASPDWETLRERHAANVMIEAAEGHFRGRFEAGAYVSADLTERMRDLIGKLASTPDQVEGKLRRDRKLEDLVYRTGSREEANQQLNQDEVGRDALNLLSLVAASAFPKAADGTMPGPSVTELLTIVLSGELIDTAAGLLHDSTQRPTAVRVRVRVGGSATRECTFTCGTDAEVETLGAQAELLTSEVMDEILAEAVEGRDRLRRFLRLPVPVAGAIVAALAVVPVVVHTGAPEIDFAVPAAVIAAGTGSWLTVLFRRRRVWNTSARDQPAIAQTLADAAAELTGFFEQEARSARLRTEFQQFLRTLKPEHAYRAVRKVEAPPVRRSRQFPGWTPVPPGEGPEIGLGDQTRLGYPGPAGVPGTGDQPG